MHDTMDPTLGPTKGDWLGCSAKIAERWNSSNDSLVGGLGLPSKFSSPLPSSSIWTCPNISMMLPANNSNQIAKPPGSNRTIICVWSLVIFTDAQGLIATSDVSSNTPPPMMAPAELDSESMGRITLKIVPEAPCEIFKDLIPLIFLSGPSEERHMISEERTTNGSMHLCSISQMHAWRPTYVGALEGGASISDGSGKGDVSSVEGGGDASDDNVGSILDTGG